MSEAKVDGGPPTASPPIAANLFSVAGSWTMRSSSWFSRVITVAGVPAGAMMPNHDTAEKPGSVAAIVGNWGGFAGKPATRDPDAP